MKNLILTAMLFFPILLFGQKLRNLKVYCTDEFNTKIPITVLKPSSDPIGLTDIINNSLVMNGFEVVSEAVAKKQIDIFNKKAKKYEAGVSENNTLEKRELEVGKLSVSKSTYVNSIYVINFTYSPYINFSGNYLLSLNGQIVDLTNNGRIVATFSYKHGSIGARMPQIVSDAFCKALKGKLKSNEK